MIERKSHRIGIIGAGAIGISLADYFLRNGHAVTFKTRRKKISALLNKRLVRAIRKGRFYENHAGINPLTVCNSFDDGFYKSAILIIECVEEVFESKVETLSTLKDATLVNPDLISSTNTSSLDIKKIGQASKLYSNLIGLHFFYPVYLIPIVEVVQFSSSKKMKANLKALLEDLKLKHLLVKNKPAFFINRILCAGFLAAYELYRNGYDTRSIDRAFIKSGAFTGPFETADRLGLDIMVAVLTQLSENVSGFFVPEGLLSKVENKQLGIKSTVGFYNYEPSVDPIMPMLIEKPDKNLAKPIADAIILETKRCIQQEIVSTGDVNVALPYVLGSLGKKIVQSNIPGFL